MVKTKFLTSLVVLRTAASLFPTDYTPLFLQQYQSADVFGETDACCPSRLRLMQFLSQASPYGALPRQGPSAHLLLPFIEGFC
jgi:hypothetical protein